MISIVKETCEILGELQQGPEPISMIGQAFWGCAVSVVTEGSLALGEAEVVDEVTVRKIRGPWLVWLMD